MSASDNYDDVLDQLRAGGLLLESIEVGRLMRCLAEGNRGRSKTGWYSLHELSIRGGKVLLVGAFGDWRSVDPQTGKPLVQKIQLKGREISREEREAIRARVAEERGRAEARREREAARAADFARRAWAKCSPTGECDYLTRKAIGTHGARFSARGNLVVPIHNEHGTIHGLQVIYGDPKVKERKGRDKDYWPAGLAKRGRYYLIGTPTSVVLLCEGFATGASLHQVTNLPVAIAFDAGNLLPVAQVLRRRYRTARILVCADDDFATKDNPGVVSASAAALAVAGAWLTPVFADDPVRADVAAKVDFTAEDWRAQVGAALNGRGKLTDFNDLARWSAGGNPTVEAQIEAKLRELKWMLGDSALLTPHVGADGGAEEFSFDLDRLLRDFVLIYGTETVFDGVRQRILALGALRAAAGKSLVRMWLEYPSRRTVLPERVVFDPCGEHDPEKTCNLWGGWPTQPRAGCCDLLIELLEYLCSHEDNPREVYQWVIKWLAYPVQHPGTKMQTAVLMHGPEGSGKNTFFGAVRSLYERYGGIFDQVQLESQFNGWASGKLFMIGNEVVTRAELYHQQGRLKNMITEREWQINEKNLPTRLEQNHCNFIFFSNRIDIAKLDKEDRRYCVIWTPPALSREFYLEVAAELAAGGAAALHDHLLALDLGDFDAHTKPPSTRSKRELIELSLDSTERFWRDWTGGDLQIPCIPCRSEDLYSGYRFWAQREGVPKSAPAYVLLAALGKKPGARKERTYHYVNGSTTSRRRSMIIWPPGAAPPDCEPEIAWLTEHIDKFAAALTEWRGPA